MKRAFTIQKSAILLLLLFFGSRVFSQPQGEFIAAIGEANDVKKIVLFNSQDGTLEVDDFIDLSVYDVGTVKQVIRVNDELWVSDQTQDVVHRLDFGGNYLGAVGESGGLDNLRGLRIINGQVWLSNAGSNNGAPGNAIVRIDFNGEIAGSFSVEGSPWSFWPYGNDHVLISFSSSGSFDSQIAEFDYDGNYISPWNVPGEINFIQEITKMANGNYLASSFSNATGGYPSGVHQYDADGNHLSIVNGSSGGSTRGNWELGNGDIMWTNNQGVHITTTGGSSSIVYSGSFQFLEKISFGPPPVLDPPTDLTAELNDNDVTLNWTVPATKDLLGYNIYRDEVSITASPVTETTYFDEDVSPGNHFYGVSAVYDNGESPKAGPVEIFIEGESGKIQGFVRDAATNLSISNAWIAATSDNNGTLTYSTPFGAHYVLNLPAGIYDLTCGAEGYNEEVVNNVTIETGMVITYTFYLGQNESEMVTGIGDPTADQLSVFPNPASEKVTVSNINADLIQIVNTSGMVEIETTPAGTQTEISIEDLPSGVYFVKITTGDKNLIRKLVIK